jgi:ribonuclease E
MSENEPSTSRPPDVQTVKGPTDPAAPLVPKIPPPGPAKPQVGDSRPASGSEGAAGNGGAGGSGGEGGGGSSARRRRRRRGGSGGGGGGGSAAAGDSGGAQASRSGQGGSGQGGSGGKGAKGGQNRGGQNQGGRGAKPKAPRPVEATDDAPVELDEKTLKKRGGRSARASPVGRYLMCVHVQRRAPPRSPCSRDEPHRALRVPPADDVSRSTATSTSARSRTCCRAWRRRSSTSAPPRTPCCTAATSSTTPRTSRPRVRAPHRGDAQAPAAIICQVTKNPIGHKGARLTQEVSLPGRFVVLVPNSRPTASPSGSPTTSASASVRSSTGSSPSPARLIVRTAAEGVTAEEIERDVTRLAGSGSRSRRSPPSSRHPRCCTGSPTWRCG